MTETNNNTPLVSLIMGSASDHPTLISCRQTLDTLQIPHEAKVLSAHRTPHELVSYVETLEKRGVKIIIAAAGMAAHLAGVIAAHSTLPILGIPIAAGTLGGVDALLAISQMPGGVPVATLGIGSAGAKNAAFMAARMLSIGDAGIRARMLDVLAANRKKVLSAKLPKDY